jgi:hypothetical protein
MNKSSFTSLWISVRITKDWHYSQVGKGRILWESWRRGGDCWKVTENKKGHPEEVENNVKHQPWLTWGGEEKVNLKHNHKAGQATLVTDRQS